MYPDPPNVASEPQTYLSFQERLRRINETIARSRERLDAQRQAQMQEGNVVLSDDGDDSVFEPSSGGRMWSPTALP